MKLFAWLLVSLLCAFGCAPLADESELGSLELGLSSRAGDETYRLTAGSFVLEGPSPTAFSAADEEVKTMSLPVGRYSLLLEDGWSLMRVDGEMLTPVSAKLISENPAAVVITAASTTRVVLRFALDDGTELEAANGELSVELAVGEAEPAVLNEADCAAQLRISEVDYDQVGSDTAEFIEIFNGQNCVASLRDVVLELVNGGDGQAYARIALSRAGASLGPLARVLVADEAVRAALPPSLLSVPLSEDLQNGAPDGVRLLLGANVIDAVSYEGAVMGASEGAGTVADEGEGGLSRCPEGLDTEDNANDFVLRPSTPGAPNMCG